MFENKFALIPMWFGISILVFVVQINSYGIQAMGIIGVILFSFGTGAFIPVSIYFGTQRMVRKN